MSKDFINIICLKWGDKFDPSYVNKLYNAVKKNVTIPFKFYCFTDDTKSLNKKIITKELPHKDISGWWQKLYLFSKEIKIKGRIFYLDLDTLIVGNIDHLLKAPGRFVCLRDFYSGKASTLKGNDHVGSAIMLWNAGEHNYIWESFRANHNYIINHLKPHGDQKWIERVEIERYYWQDLFPNHICSFKAHCRNSIIPHNTKIICFHGVPSIPQAIYKDHVVHGMKINKAPWILNYWKD